MQSLTHSVEWMMGKGKKLNGWFIICHMVTFPLRSGAFPPLLFCLLSLVPHWPFLLTFHSPALGSMLLWMNSQFHKAPRGRVLCVESLWNPEPLEPGSLSWGLGLPLPLCVTLTKDWIFYIYLIWNGDNDQNNTYLRGLGGLSNWHI